MDTDTQSRHAGSCLCGGVKFEVHGPLKDVVGCHCISCRKQTGHFLAFTAAWNDHLVLIEDCHLQWYQSSEAGRRGFCGNCGASLFFAFDGAERTSISAGAFDGPTGLKMAAHTFVDEIGDYYDLSEDCPRLARGGDKVPMPPKD